MQRYHAKNDRPFSSQAKKQKRREWRFGIKDVLIISCVGLTLSGLTGVGALLIVQWIDTLLR